MTLPRLSSPGNPTGPEGTQGNVVALIRLTNCSRWQRQIDIAEAEILGSISTIMTTRPAVKTRRTSRSIALVVIGIWAAGGSATLAQSIPGEAPDAEVLKTQEKAHELYERGKFERALMVYRDDLAPIGDKYAQYMIGYMYFAGHGVVQDQIAASAWYRLAAERGTAEYARVSDQLLALMNAEQRQRSDQIYRQLKAKYGDARLLTTLINEDLEFLRQRVKSDPFDVDSLGRRNYDRKIKLYNRIAERAQRRVYYLREIVSGDESSTETDWQAFNQLNQALIAEIESLENHNAMAPP